MAVPAITSITPTGGSVAGGETITIVGTDLGTPTAVAFGSTAATAYVGESATRAYAVVPAGTGAVFVTLTTAGGTSATGAASTYTYGAVLFTVAEARAFNDAVLASTTDYTSADIILKEAEVREWLEKACGQNFVATTHTDEYHDGDGTGQVMLDWPLVTSITAVSYRSPGDSTWTALDSDQLGVCQYDDNGMLTSESVAFPAGNRTVKVTYVAGCTAVPTKVKRAALLVCTYEMRPTNLSPAAESYDTGEVSYSFGRGDGFNRQWSKIPEVMSVIRQYDRSLTGIA